tara:strand:- start:1535 stop:1753 length:219 start_codon:yes stop_codon:yes gene_type:complete
MSGKRYTDEFKIEAVKQVTERGYKIAEVAERLGVSYKSYTLGLPNTASLERAEKRKIQLCQRSSGSKLNLNE